MTIWEAVNLSELFEYLEQSINLDKYVNGEYDKDKTFTENPGYVPYSFEMPDYLELNFC